MSSKNKLSSPWPAWQAPAGVALATFLAFLPALQNHFVNWDDNENFFMNLQFRGLGWSHLVWMFGASAKMGSYIPVTWLTLGLDYQFWGMNPLGYHLTNVVIHAANAVLFFYLARLLFDAAQKPSTIENEQQSILAAVFAALFFSLHPLRVESVAWVTERRDVVSGFFFLLTLIAYIQYTRRKRGAYAASLIFYVLALLSKPIVVTLPVVLSLLDIYPLQRVKNSWTEKIPYYVLAVPVAIVTIGLQSQVGFMATTERLGISQRLFLGVYGSSFYIWKTLLPFGLRPLYPMGATFSWITPPVLAGLVFVLGISAAAWAWRRRWPAFSLSWAYYLVVLLPVSGLLLTGNQRAADRYSYLPCLAWALLGGWAVAKPSQIRRVIGGLVLAMCLVLTLRQCRVWANSESLWTAELAGEPDSYLAHNNLATFYQGTGRLDEAIHHYEEVIRLKPDFAEAHANLGLALQQQGKMEQAIPHFQESIRLKPQYATAYSGLGLSMFATHHRKEAIALFKQALAINPQNEAARTNLEIAQRGIVNASVQIPGDAEYAAGLALERKNQWKEAAAQFESTIEQNPKHADAYYQLGYAHVMLNEQDLAFGLFQKALALNPQHPLANNYVGALLIARRQAPEAIPYFERALAVQPHFADAENNWGVALATQRRFAEALPHFERALQDDPTLEKARRNVDMAQRFLAAPSTP